MEAGAKPSKPAMRLSRRQANVVEIFVASRQGVQEAKASGVGDKHRSHQTRKLRRCSAAVATSLEGHLSGFHPVAPHAPECLGAFVIWTDFKCPTRSTLQIRCRRTALRARRSRIRANYRKA